MSALVTFVRHGRTAYNASRRVQGWGPVPLDDLGRAQARAVAARLAGHERSPTRLIASDLLRTRETAEIIGRALNLPVELDPAFREVNVGEWQDRFLDEIERDSPELLARWPLVAAPGGEALHEVAARLRGGFDRLEIGSGEHLVVVSHGAALAALVCDLHGWNLEDAWTSGRAHHENTAVTTYELDLPGRESRCLTLACAAHLTSGDASELRPT